MRAEPSRPFFNKSIAQLEALLELPGLDTSILRSVEQELTHRTTARASKLHAKVVESLGTRQTRQSETPNKKTIVRGAQLEPARSTSPDAAVSKNNEVSTIEDLGVLPVPKIPTNRNEPRGIIAAWIALEALSPQTYRRPEDMAAGDRRCVAQLSERHLPWNAGERSRPNRRLYYQVILGSVSMGRATEELIEAFGIDEEQNQRPVQEKAAIAAVLVDKNGIVVEENGIGVSSFAWALPLALRKKLNALGAWPGVEPKIIEKLEAIVRRFDPDGVPLPLDLPTIDRAYRWLVAQFDLSAQLIEPPAFALRVYHYYKAKNPPEVSLLNSFFLGDLARASSLIERNIVPTGLRRYLGMERPKETVDLLANKTALEKIIAPAMMPNAKWPTPGGHPLVMLQQAALNVARSELSNGEGVIAVNGPPGTGKTTLLRDVVAMCVLDRGLAMASFEDPEKAFTASGEKVSAGDRAFFHLYTLDPSLKGHEVLVASSNNKAVENVSRELPAKKAIGRTTAELNYFKSVSDLVYGQRGVTEDDDEITPEPVKTWGLIAAVLGNARNRAAFQQTFWWHEDYSFRLYLKAAKGDSVVIEATDPETGNVTNRRTPAIVLAENPPTPQAARANWQKARTRLLDLKNEIDAELKVLEEVRGICLQSAETRRALEAEEAALAGLVVEQKSLESVVSSRRADVETAADEHRKYILDRDRHRETRPGFFARLFRTVRWKVWSDANMPLVAAVHAGAERLRFCEHPLKEAMSALETLGGKMQTSEASLAVLRQQLAILSESVEAHRQVLGERIVDEAFFKKNHEVWNLSPPWIPDTLHRKREEIFIAALAVHRAFIDSAAQKILHNLSILMNVFSSGPMQDEAQRKLLGDLWSTLFLVVPVISTTFASIDRMLGNLPVGSIGWLLIDEAGQALPQAAVGAIMRSKRSIVVGDPLQIPPIVTLPERLNAEICNFFKVDKTIWAAPDASAQTLADQSSKFQAAFRSDQGPRKVGVPLLVHRRCQEPMFGISNRVAYDGQMVHASGPPDIGSIGTALGPSAWFDIDGEADSKWCPAEGTIVLALLRKIATAGIADPDVFIITPFRIVAQEMRRLLEKEQTLLASFQVNGTEWVNNRVGTIHTFQGREADSVILLLGSPKASQNGARSWAAGTPNILNVAVSRAKENLYVVGSHGAWSGVGHARELGSALPRHRT